MIWVWVLLVVVVIGVTVAVAAGRGDGLTPAQPDRPDVRLPADRALRAEELDDLRFSVGFRGYRMDEVDDVLSRLTEEIAARDELLAQPCHCRDRSHDRSYDQPDDWSHERSQWSSSESGDRPMSGAPNDVPLEARNDAEEMP